MTGPAETAGLAAEGGSVRCGETPVSEQSKVRGSCKTRKGCEQVAGTGVTRRKPGIFPGYIPPVFWWRRGCRDVKDEAFLLPVRVRLLQGSPCRSGAGLTGEG